MKREREVKAHIGMLVFLLLIAGTTAGSLPTPAFAEPQSGTVVASFASPGSLPWGLAWDGQYLWCSVAGVEIIYKLNASTGSVITSFASPGSYASGLAWDGQYLWHAAIDPDTIYKLNPSTGSVITSFASPGPDPTGLAWDGQYLWNAAAVTDTIYKIDVGPPTTGSISGTISYSGAETGPICVFVRDYPTITGDPSLHNDISTRHLLGNWHSRRHLHCMCWHGY